MPTHAEKRMLPYTPQQMFDLVADVEKYPEFLPWCLDCKITRRDGDVIYADLVIGYKMVQERFGSRVTLRRPDSVHVEYLSGPMKHLSNHWRFEPHKNGACAIDFYVDFEFRNFFFRALMDVFFNEAVRRMVRAFEDRARALYGAGNPKKSGSGRKKRAAEA